MTGVWNFLRSHTGLWLLLAFTLLVRGGLMIARFDQLRDDPDDYSLIAHNLVRMAVFSVDDASDFGGREINPTPSAFRPPLYPVLLSNLAIGKDKIIYLDSIALLHLAMGLATVWLTWVIARALELGWSSYFAGALVACDPILLNQQSLVMTETLAALCTVIALSLLVRFHFDRNWWNAALAGGAIGLAALCRPSFLPWLFVSAVVILFMQPGKLPTVHAKSNSKKTPSHQAGLRLLNAAALLIGGLGVLFPWAWRNYQAFGEPLLTTTHGGYTLYLANNRHFYSYLRNDDTGLPWNPREQTVFGDQLRNRQSFREERYGLLYGAGAPQLPNDATREFVVDRLQTEQARREMRDDPAGFVRAATHRVQQLWSPLPYKLTADESFSRTLLRYLTAGGYLGVYALALVGIYRLRGDLLHSPWIWGILLCLIFTGIHTLYWCNLRMRAPLMPIVAIIAATGALHLSQLGRNVPTPSSEG